MNERLLYLDTTIPSAYFDLRTPERQRATHFFWLERMRNYRPVISPLVVKEIEGARSPNLRVSMLSLISEIQVLPVSEESLRLAEEYVKRGVFPERYISDAIHIAVASVSGARYFASWNYKHFVNISSRCEINLVNALLGYGNIDIATPPEF